MNKKAFSKKTNKEKNGGIRYLYWRIVRGMRMEEEKLYYLVISAVEGL